MRWINEISAVDQSTVFDYPMARPYLPFEIVSGEDGKGTTYYVSAASGHVRIPSGVVVLGQSLDVNALTGDLHRDIIHAVNQARIQSVEQLRSTLRQLKSGDPLVLQIEPQGQLHYIDWRKLDPFDNLKASDPPSWTSPRIAWTSRLTGKM